MPKSNGQKPVITDQTFGTLESPADGTYIGTVVSNVPPKLSTWSIVSGNDDGTFGIDPKTGQLYVTDGSAVDYEADQTRSLVVQVVEKGKTAYSATMTINVTDVDELPLHAIGDTEIVPFSPFVSDGYRVSSGNNILYSGNLQQIGFADGTWDVTFVTDVGSNYLPGTSPSYSYIYGGSASNNIIFGSSNSDWIEGFGGNDYIVGLDGNDSLGGNEGNDYLIGGDGNDQLIGGAGRDVLVGGNGNDQIWADGLQADAVVNGGAGDDSIQAFAAGSAIIGGEGNDTINFYAESDATGTILDAETISAYFGPQASGDVVLSGNNYNVRVQNDNVNLDFETAGNLRLGWASSDAAATYFDIGPNIINVDTAHLTSPSNEVFTLKANDKDNYIFGSGNNEIIYAGEGDDYVWTNNVWAGSGPAVPYGEVYGEGGNDTLMGGFEDRLFGGSGNDILGGTASDFTGGEGSDTFIFSDSFGIGTDFINDFSQTEGDKIEYKGAGVDSFDDLTITQSGANTVITTSASATDGVSLVDYDNSAHPLTADDFWFV